MPWFSSWQFLGLGHALSAYDFIAHRWRGAGISPSGVAHNRRLDLTLTALAPIYLPSVLGRAALPPGVTQALLWRHRTYCDVLGLQHLTGFAPDRLRREAEYPLTEAASRDPMAKWLPLLRYASHSGWTKLKACLWTACGSGWRPRCCCVRTRTWPRSVT